MPPRLSILDVGAGSGDVNRALLRWANHQALDLRITLIDIHPETCAAAAAYYQDEPRVQVQQGDLFDLAPNQADIVTASLFLHHFTDAQLPAAWSALLRAARIGVVVNDLHRHPVAWIGIRVATQLLSRNRMIRHDGPLSVQRGFQAADFMRLRSLPGDVQFDVCLASVFSLSGDSAAHLRRGCSWIAGWTCLRCGWACQRY